MDRGAWWVTAHEVARSQTQLSNQKTTNSIMNDFNKICFSLRLMTDSRCLPSLEENDFYRNAYTLHVPN